MNVEQVRAALGVYAPGIHLEFEDGFLCYAAEFANGDAMVGIVTAREGLDAAGAAEAILDALDPHLRPHRRK